MNKPKAKADMPELVLYGDVGFEITAKEVSNDLAKMHNAENIRVRINSFGGDVFDGLAIYNRLTEHPANIEISVDGIAASAASIIAMAGDTIRVAEAGIIMIHDAMMIAMGNATELRKSADRAEKASLLMAGIYQRRTKQPMEAIRAWMIAETEFDGDEATEFGFATETFDDEPLEAKFSEDRHLFKRKPTILLPKDRREAARLVGRMKMYQTMRRCKALRH